MAILYGSPVDTGVGGISGSLPTSNGALVGIGGSTSWEPNHAGRILFRMGPGAGDNEVLLQDTDPLVNSASRGTQAWLTQLALK